MAIYKEVSQRIENPGQRSFGVQFRVSPIDRTVQYDLYGKMGENSEPTFFSVSAPFQSDTLAVQHTIVSEKGELPMTSFVIGPVINVIKISGVDMSANIRRDTPNPPITSFHWEKEE